VKDLYSETIKHQRKKLKETVENGKTTPCHLHVHGLAYCENGYITKESYRFLAIPIKITMTFITK
jgi:hypothetical protein